MRDIGLHLRIDHNLIDLYTRAQTLGLSSFQCFFISQQTMKFYRPDAQEINACNGLNNSFKNRFLHGSYWINLADNRIEKQPAFKAEIRLAQKLGFTHVILHPGSFKGSTDRTQALVELAQTLDKIVNSVSDIKIVLENVAHGGMAIGGDLNDFKCIKESMKFSDKIFFCLDTAHAFSYGYDISHEHGQRLFIELLSKTIGLESLELIHFNDTDQKLGSKIDRHVFLGEGVLGIQPLKTFVWQPELKQIPLLMELPPSTIEQEREMLALVRSWYAKEI